MVKINTILDNLPRKRKPGYQQTRKSVAEEVLIAQSTHKCANCKESYPKDNRQGILRPTPAILCKECKMHPDKESEVQADLSDGVGGRNQDHHGSIGAMYEKQINS
jgi:hypothetical protein